MDFGDKNLWQLIDLGGGLRLYVTESILGTWVVMGVLIAFAIVVRVKLKNFKPVPSGFQTAIESMVGAIDGMVKSMMGPGFGEYGGIFFSIFSFIILSNYISLLGFFRSPTSNIATTAGLALFVFISIHSIGFMKSRSRYFKDFIAPLPIFLPLNIIGDLAKPISLCFRLFGNVLSGVIIFGLVYNMLLVPIRFGFPALMHAYFDIFVGALQAYIFTVLSMAFIQQKAVL